MPFTLATTYSPVLDQVFTLDSQTNDLNGDGGYSFTDAKTIVITSVVTDEFVPYNRADTLLDALEDVTNVENTTESYTISQYVKNVKHFEFFDEMEQPALTVAKFELAVTKERYTPMVDAYRLSVLCAAATSNGQLITGTAAGYTDTLGLNAFITNARAPRSGRVIYGNTDYEQSIKLDPHFVPYTSDQLAKVRDGSIGYIDNAKVIILPDDYLPEGFRAVGLHTAAVFGPRGIKKSAIKEVAGKPGKNVEVYARFDLFVLSKKELAIAAITGSISA